MDRTNFTTARELIELMVAEKFGRLPVATRGEVREFTAVALTDAIPLSKSKFEEYVTAKTGAPANDATISRFILKAMIMGDVNGDPLPLQENPHRFLLNPCNLDIAADVNLAIRLIMMYTTYISARDFNIDDGQALTIKKNDRIKVSMTVDQFGNIHMERGEVVELVQRAKDSIVLQNTCQNLEGIFQSNPVSLLGGADPGNCSWSNGASQYTTTWKETGVEMRNGQLETTGMLVTDEVRGAKLVPPALEDFKRLAAAFETQFPGNTLYVSGYRTYQTQVDVRMKRHVSPGVFDCGAGEVNANGVSIGMAAPPGQSNHGWGAAVDVARERSGWEHGDATDVELAKTSDHFKWMNVNSTNFNFVAGVSNETWHFDWVPFPEHVTGNFRTATRWVPISGPEYTEVVASR